MINIIAIFLTISLLVFLIFFKRKSLLDFRVFTLLYFLFFYQLSFYSYYFIEKKIDYDFANTIGLFTFISISAYFMAMLFLKFNIFKHYKNKSLYTYNQYRISIVILFITFFIFILLTIYYVRAGTFPIFLTSIEDQRIALASKVSGFVIVLLQFMFVLYVLVLSKLFHKKNFFLILITLFSGISFWLLMASKRPVAGLLLIFLILYTNQYKRVKNSTLIFSVFSILLLIILYGSFRLFGDITVEHMLKILTAIFNAEMFNLSLVLNNPPPLQLGQTYLNSILMIFTDVKDIGTVLKDYYELDFKGGGITIGIIGEGWINFSYLGVLFESFLFWLMIIILAKKMETASKYGDYFSMGKYAFYFYFLLWILRNGFFAAITPLMYFVIFEFITLFVRRKIYVK